MYDDDLFEGAAQYYARYRVGYPLALFDQLAERFDLTSQSHVLDIGCGTGLLSLPFASRAAAVTGVDPDRNMLREAAHAAERAKVQNVRWIQCKGEELGPWIGSFKLATAGRCFAYMDRRKVLENLAHVIGDEGGIAIVNEDRTVASGIVEFAPGNWRDAIFNYAAEWHGGRWPAGRNGTQLPNPTLAPDPTEHEEVLSKSPFGEIETFDVPYTYDWTTDQLIGWTLSTSLACPGVLGPRQQEFEGGLRSLLHNLSPTGRFTEKGRVIAMIGRRTRH